MKSHLLDMAPYLDMSRYVVYALAFLQFLRTIRWLWSRVRKEVAPITPKTRRESVRFLSALVSVATIAFGVIILLAIGLQKTSPLSPTLVVLAGGVGGLAVLGQLIMAVGVPAYNYTMSLEERCQHLELQDRIRDERLRLAELEIQSMRRFLEEQFPTQQKLAFMNSMVNAATRDEYTS